MARTIDTTNQAGGVAFSLSPKHALAQVAATGCLTRTFYADADAQLTQLYTLASEVDDTYLAKLALYAREKAAMKDMPAALLVLLSRRSPELFHKVFDRVIDNGRVLRTFFQLIRSGELGRKSLSYSLQRAFSRWLNNASVGALMSASIGNKPSLRDVLRAARPTPKDNARRALFGWFVGKPAEKWTSANYADLPHEVSALEAFRACDNEDGQLALLEHNRFRWDLISGDAKGPKVWKAIAKQMGHQALRMNLNTLLRHEVFNDPSMVKYVAEKLESKDEIARAKQFPYQYFAAYINAQAEVPERLRKALVTAAEVACGNIPELPGPVLIGVDVSGSMGSPITGYRTGHTTSMTCVQAASLFGAALLRRNPKSVIIPFDTSAHTQESNADEPILELTARMARYGGGGTDCSIPLKTANTQARLRDRRFSAVVMLSDNESWAAAAGTHGRTAMLQEWDTFRKNQKKLGNPDAKLICLDFQPNRTTQAPDRKDILNVGGFSDAVFEVVSNFLNGDEDRFVKAVEAMEIE